MKSRLDVWKISVLAIKMSRRKQLMSSRPIIFRIHEVVPYENFCNKRWKMMIDFRALNERTIGDVYPLLNVTEILDQPRSAKYFSVFDLASGFHQISWVWCTKTAILHGHYQFNRMLFGWKNAPAMFQRLMDQVLSGIQRNDIFVSLEDIVIYASSLAEHETKFNNFAEQQANHKLQPDMNFVGYTDVDFCERK